MIVWGSDSADRHPLQRTEVPVLDERLVFEVEGRTIVVEPADAGWRAQLVEEGHERDIRIPSWVQADELPRFLSRLFDRGDTSGRSDVRQVW